LPASVINHVGIVGLGNMGGNLALQAMEKGFAVSGYTVGPIDPRLTQAGVRGVDRIEALGKSLERPRFVMIYVPAGDAVDQVLGALGEALEDGDIVADCGNSYWGDSIRRQRRLKERGLHLLDVGTSGGTRGARHGACFMVGGEVEPVERAKHIFEQLAVREGFVHAGPPGAGHFVKLVHNGIEFGMLQAIGEGVDLLESYHERLDVAAVLHCWRNGSVIRSWLIDLIAAGYRGMSGLESVPSHVEDTGEVNWLVSDALRMEVPVPVIAQAVAQLFASRDSDRTWARAIAVMRKGFGEHPYGPVPAIAERRRTSRVGPIFDPERDTD
jgi:6-phosphogluconate dehydrogenase